MMNGKEVWSGITGPLTAQKAIDAIDAVLAEKDAEIARLRAQYDALNLTHTQTIIDCGELQRFVHAVMITMVEAGGKSGDTTVQLANVRNMVQERDRLRADLAALIEAARAVASYPGPEHWARLDAVLARPGVRAVDGHT